MKVSVSVTVPRELSHSFIPVPEPQRSRKRAKKGLAPNSDTPAPDPSAEDTILPHAATPSSERSSSPAITSPPLSFPPPAASTANAVYTTSSAGNEDEVCLINVHQHVHLCAQLRITLLTTPLQNHAEADHILEPRPSAVSDVANNAPVKLTETGADIGTLLSRTSTPLDDGAGTNTVPLDPACSAKDTTTFVDFCRIHPSILKVI